MDNNFYTLRGYDVRNHHELSSAMEDYLEMICRYSKVLIYVRVNFLAEKLNVTPPSASKMVNKLKELGYVEFQPYGLIKPTKKGMDMGDYLLWRHNILEKFFTKLNNSDSELELVEKIEHFIPMKTIKNMEELMNIIKDYT